MTVRLSECAYDGSSTVVQRCYSRLIGRFLTLDPYQASGGPAEPQSWNRYSYVQNDPVNFRDPKGLMMEWWEPFDGGGGGFWPGWGAPVPFGGGMSWGGLDYSGLGTPPPDEDREPTPSAGDGANTAAGPAGVLTAAYFSALDALKTDDCAGLFNTSGRRQYNPRDVLASMIFGGSTGTVPSGAYFGSVTLGRIRLDAAAVTVPDPKTSVTTGVGVVASSANIVLQSNRLSESYYGSLNAQELALILIHELGHVFNIVDGLGGSKIVWDANPNGSPNQDAENRNADTLKNCKPE